MVFANRLFLFFILFFIFFLASNAQAVGYPHYLQNGLSCSSCHDVFNSEPKLMPPWTSEQEPQDIDDTQFNKLCWSCHQELGSAPYVVTHSSLQADDSYGHWTVECRVCHEPHFQMQARTYTSDFVEEGVSTEITATTLTKSGAGWSEGEFEGMILIPNKNYIDYSYKITGNTSETITVDPGVPEGDPETMNLNYAQAGNPFVVSYGKLVRSTVDRSRILEYIDWDPSGGNINSRTGKPSVKLIRPEGDNSFVDSDSTYDGVCQVCHSMTNHFRYTGEVNVASGGYDHTDAVGTYCIRCHSHENGFMHGSGSEGCVQCHGHDAGSEYDPDMAYPPSLQGGTSSIGAGSSWSHSTHTEFDNDDKVGPQIYCDTCHDTSNMPLFKNQDSSGGHSLAETDICNNCHSPGGTYNGVNSTNGSIGAKENWHTGVYETGRVLQAGKEKWCAGCHDEEPGNSWWDDTGIDAPNIVGDEDADFNYGTGWGFYKTGHGLDNTQYYPASGGVTNGAGRICSGCHDQTMVHLDGIERTFDYSSGDGSALYQTGYRLKDINSSYPMHIRTDGIESYNLCFNCHTNTDQWIGAAGQRNDTNFWSGTVNDHYKHMLGISSTSGGIHPDYDWDGNFETGNPSCITCHNVHGSTNPAMVRDGSLSDRPGFITRYGNSCEDFGTGPGGASAWEASDITLAESTILATQKSSFQGLYCANTCHGTGTGYVTISRTPAIIPGRVPELDWVGGQAYASDGANPDSGESGTEFTFKVSYSDMNQDPPDYVQLWIDRDNDGAYEDAVDPPEKIAMDLAFAGLNDCAEYSKGVDYVAYVTLDKQDLQAGDTIKYTFRASGNGDDATGPATVDSTMTILNDGPTLEWTGEVDYENDGVDPDYGSQDGTFTFRVKYVDDDGDTCPAGGTEDIQVWVDLEGDGYQADDKHNLSEVAAGDTDCTGSGGGKLYYADLVLPNSSGSDSVYDYRFFATDGTDNATGIPVSTGGIVTVAGTGGNNPPFLAWESGTCRPEGAMPPRSALTSTVDFAVRYFDEDNQCPTGGTSDIQVWVDLNGISGYEAGEKFNLAEDDAGDTDCTTAGGGKLYTLEVTPTTVADSIAYEFHATDGTDEALGNPRTAGGTIDVIDADFVVRQDGSEDYTTISDAILNSTSGDTILVYDGTYNEYVSKGSGVYYNMNLYSACGPDETIISHSNDPVLYIYRGGNSIVDGFTVTGSSGAGVRANGNDFDLADSQPAFNNCIIRDNAGRGMVSYRSKMTITNCEIYQNTGGGIQSYAADISDSTIRDNSVSGDGGGIASTSESGAFTLTNVVIRDNTATGNGGGIYCNVNSSYSPAYEKVTLSGNSANGTGGGGYFTYCYPTLTNSLVSDNNGASGGGIGVGIWSSVWLENSSIVNNTATTGNGGAFFSSDGAVNLANSIAWGNRTSSGSGHIGYFSGSSKTIYLYDSIIENNGDKNITDDNYFVAVNNSSVNDTGTNYDTDPNFVNPHANGDYHIQSPSDAIDNAADSSGRGIPGDDLDGNSRPAGSEDIGAYEFIP